MEMTLIGCKKDLKAGIRGNILRLKECEPQFYRAFARICEEFFGDVFQAIEGGVIGFSNFEELMKYLNGKEGSSSICAAFYELFAQFDLVRDGFIPKEVLEVYQNMLDAGEIPQAWELFFDQVA